MRQRQNGSRLFITLTVIVMEAGQVGHAVPGQRYDAGKRKEDSPLGRQALIADVVAQARRDEAEDGRQATKNGSIYFVVSVGAARYEYRMRDWKPVAQTMAHKQFESGIVEGWANVFIDRLDSHKKSNVQGAEWLFHYSKGRWRRVALNEGPGYERKRLRELGMSDTQIRRLHLEVNE